MLAQAERLFGALPGAGAARPDAAAARAGGVARGAHGAGRAGPDPHGRLAPSLTDPDFAAMKVVTTVLGGGLAGRFFSELRDKQGLAYTTAAR